MALKTFNVQGGLSVGSKGDIFDANANLNLSNSIANVTLGNVGNLHVSGGNANTAVLGTVSLNGDGNVTSIAITTRGDGYTIAPTITITGGNSGAATATANLFANGAIDTITITAAGTGYASGTVAAAISAPSTKYLQTDGAGNLAWSEVAGTGGGGGGTPGGSNTQIQFNDNGVFGGTAGLTFNKTSNAIIANGNITATNFITSGTSGNITGANVVAANTLKASSGVVVTSNNGTTVQQVTIQGSTNAGFTANYTLTLPVDDGTSGQALVTDGSGILSWTTISSSSIANGNSNVNIPAANGNVNISSAGNANIVVVTGTGANVAGTANITGDILAGANVNVTSNINAATLQNGNSKVGIAANANITLTAKSNATMVISDTGANITGTANVSGNANVGNLGTATAIITTGNITTVNTGLVQNGNSNVTIAANGNVSINASGASGALTLTTGGNLILPNVLVAKASDNGSIIFSGDGANANGYIKVDGGKNMVINSEADFSIKRNGTDRITITTSNTTISSGSNVVLQANSNTVVAITSSGDGNLQTTGGNVTGYWNVSGNVIAGNLVGKLANGNSNIAIAANANITLTANSNAVVVVTSSGDGNAQTTGGNVTGYWNVSGNAVAANFVGTVANGNSNLRMTSNGNVGITSNGQSNILFITSNGTFAQSTFQNDVTITGNLVVQGNAIYANTETLTIEDPIIELGTGANGSVLTANDGKDRGLELHTYGNGAAYTTSGSTPSGNTTIVLSSTSGIVAGQLVTFSANPAAIPIGTTVSTVNAGNIVISNATAAVIATASTLQIGNDILRFMGWSNANAEFQFYSNATITGEVVSGTLGNVNANTFIGALKGNLVNGNSNVTVAANANVQIAANGNSIVTVTSSGDGNLRTTGVNVAGYINSTANVVAANFVGILANGNSNISIASNANINISSNGIANAVTVSANNGSNVVTLNINSVNQMGSITVSGGLSARTLDVYGAVNGSNAAPSGGTANSIYFPGTTNDYMVFDNANANASGDLSFQTGDGPFTYEFWLKNDGTQADGATPFSSGPWRDFFAPVNQVFTANGSTSIGAANMGIARGSNFGTTIDADITAANTAWNHFAVTGNSANTTINFFVNGTSVSEQDTSSGYFQNFAQSYFGKVNPSETSLTPTAPWKGWMYGFRFSNSLRYTSTFTPSATYGVDGNTLIFFDAVPGSQSYNSNLIVGNITAGGNVSIAGNLDVGMVGNFSSYVTAPNASFQSNVSVGTYITANSLQTLSDASLALGGSATVAGANTGLTFGGTTMGAVVSQPISKIGATQVTTTTTSSTRLVTVLGNTARGWEYTVVGSDATGTKYEIQKVTAIHDGNVGSSASSATANVDYTKYSTVTLTGSPGSVTVGWDTGNITVFVTAASTNSTVWTTQWRAIE